MEDGSSEDFSQHMDMCSDEEIEEMEIAEILQDYIAWMEIYSITEFFKARRKTNKHSSAQDTLELVRSHAGVWTSSSQMAPWGKANSQKSQNNNNKKQG